MSGLTNKMIYKMKHPQRAFNSDLELKDARKTALKEELDKVDITKASAMLKHVSSDHFVEIVKRTIKAKKTLPGLPPDRLARNISKFTPDDIPKLHDLGKGKLLVNLDVDQARRLTAQQALNIRARLMKYRKAGKPEWRERLGIINEIIEVAGK